ncbi:MAG: acylphosphatase [Candidatus Pacebacteria bacterium]|nr:acylphosphatase [Candidatus Paceibacterota bacterium]MBP9840062.1 acylphosphatase [Candidatus Paceibacterota bacterium]
MSERLEAIVRGRVQMVMYRDYVKRFARRLGLVGYVRNLIDGTVEVIAEGPRVSLEKLVKRMETGSFLSEVDSVEVEYYPIKGGMKSFDIRFE